MDRLPENNELLAMLHKMDQGRENRKLFAEIVHDHFTLLCETGFTREEAFLLTQTFHREFWQTNFRMSGQRQ